MYAGTNGCGRIRAGGGTRMRAFAREGAHICVRADVSSAACPCRRAPCGGRSLSCARVSLVLCPRERCCYVLVRSGAYRAAAHFLAYARAGMPTDGCSAGRGKKVTPAQPHGGVFANGVVSGAEVSLRTRRSRRRFRQIPCARPFCPNASSSARPLASVALKCYRGVTLSHAGREIRGFGCRIRSIPSACRRPHRSGATAESRSRVRLSGSVAPLPPSCRARGEILGFRFRISGNNPSRDQTVCRVNDQSRFISPPSRWNCTLVCPPSTKSSILGK